MKIGIMTMHRVQNIGSVLQAYALQYKIRQLGFESELIDYVFPSIKKEHNNIKSMVSWCYEAIQGFPGKKRQAKIEAFRRDFLCCSQVSYNRENLLVNPPQYDVYCTGSDQVWNPFHIGEDTSFMMDFAPTDAPRFAYASSFASKEVNEPYFSLYSKYLSRYIDITVREKSGAQIVKSMTGKDATVVCDPTLLLSDSEWNNIAEKSDVTIKGGYILIYLLSYMFNPRPYFYDIVETVRHNLSLPVYHYNPYTADSFKRNIKPLKGMGPHDFVRIFRDASFVITDSFHGAVFATIFNKPLIGIVKDEHDGDGRISTLRSQVDGCNSIVCYNKPFSFDRSNIDDFKCNIEKVDTLRQFGSDKLIDMINEAVSQTHHS